MPIVLSTADWWAIVVQFFSLSLLAVGGAITTAPDMHRYFVDQQHWLTDAQFNSSIALAQASPGPNVLFIAMMGWNLGVSAAGGVAVGAMAWPMGLFGAIVCLLAIMAPSSVLTYFATQWGHRNRELRGVRAFKSGMAPIVIALLIATGWLLTAAHNDLGRDWRLWLMTAVAALIVWKTKTHLLVLLGAGALLGGLGWV